ncbi:pantoate kinase [Halopenitus persicus]|uniref:Pantoate kinase n=1 Tax=Halopenitus persicus TaxID=1048396 RepID=A0A1H3GEI5_9EURY|nr:pantoate kinase [Halopenitus persicus]SDY01467.1 pantothenate kinase [Halopenitus persicus]
MTDDRSSAFVPGHVTAFFSAHPDEVVHAAGSRGAGVTISDGVTVTVDPVAEPGETPTQTVNGESTTIEPVTLVLSKLDVDARVAIETDLPLGAGFGVSGAAALGTALAAADALEAGRSENDLIRTAHAAEIEAGTGLGDVVAQARGGIPIRLEPGAPGYGALDGVPATARIEYVTFGELSTESVLADDTADLSAAGERALTTVEADPTLETLMDASRTFAREAGLLVPPVAEAIDLVDDVGGEASMAMLGRTVFALGTGLSDAGYDPTVCRVHPGGSRVCGTDDTAE